MPPRASTRLAKRVPVVVVAGDTAQRGVDVVSADNWSGRARARRAPGRRARQAPPVPRRRAADRAGRRRPAAGHAGGHRRAPGHRADRLLPRPVHRAQRRGGGASGCWPTPARRAAAARRDRLRQRPDGHRRGAHAGRARRPGPGGRGGGRLRRHFPRQPLRPAADHRAPADAQDRRARLRPAARADRRPALRARGSNCCRPSWCCGRAAAARRARDAAPGRAHNSAKGPEHG